MGLELVAVRDYGLSIRGKIYAAFVLEATGISLYEYIDCVEVHVLRNKLVDIVAPYDGVENDWDIYLDRGLPVSQVKVLIDFLEQCIEQDCGLLPFA